MDLEEPSNGRRRRGAELEHALLAAAWAELVDLGYGALSFDGVARRAGTSRAVLYRRWSTKADLVLAAVVHILRRDAIPAPDTGTLRGDILALLRAMDGERVARSAMAISYLGGYFQETGSNPADLRLAVGVRPDNLDLVIDRAVTRGEVDARRATPRIRRVASDLVRHEVLMTMKPVPDDVLFEIVDDIFLPLVLTDVPGV